MGDVVKVLHAHNGRNRLRFGDLIGGDGTEAEVLDQSLLLELRERGEWPGNGGISGTVESSDAQIHGVKYVEPEVVKIVEYALAQLLGCERLRPAALVVSKGADLGDDV